MHACQVASDKHSKSERHGDISTAPRNSNAGETLWQCSVRACSLPEPDIWLLLPGLAPPASRNKPCPGWQRGPLQPMTYSIRCPHRLGIVGLLYEHVCSNRSLAAVSLHCRASRLKCDNRGTALQCTKPLQTYYRAIHNVANEEAEHTLP